MVPNEQVDLDIRSAAEALRLATALAVLIEASGANVRVRWGNPGEVPAALRNFLWRESIAVWVLLTGKWRKDSTNCPHCGSDLMYQSVNGLTYLQCPERPIDYSMQVRCIT